MLQQLTWQYSGGLTKNHSDHYRSVLLSSCDKILQYSQRYLPAQYLLISPRTEWQGPVNKDILGSVKYVIFSALGTLHDQLDLVHTGFKETLQITINIGNHHQCKVTKILASAHLNADPLFY